MTPADLHEVVDVVIAIVIADGFFLLATYWGRRWLARRTRKH